MDSVGIQVPERNRRDDTLGDAVGIDGIGAVVVVADRPVPEVKAGFVEVVAPPKVRFEFPGLQFAADAIECAEIIAGMEVVGPSLGRQLAVVPATVRKLLSGRVTRNPKSRT